MKLNDYVKNFFQNWPSKVICFVLALILYFFHQSTAIEKKHLSIPLTVKASGQVTPVREIPRFVRLKLKARSSDIASLKENDFTAIIDVSAVTATGRYDIPVQVLLSDNATSIEPLEIEVFPSHINLPLEERTIAYVPVEPNFSGKLKDGFYLERYTIEPNTIKIVGAKSVVENTGRLMTTAVKLDSIDSSTTQTVKIENISSVIEVDLNTVFTVDLKVQKIISEKTYTGFAFKFENLDSKINLSTDTKAFSVKVKAPEEELKNFLLSENSIYVDCHTITDTGNYELEVHTNFPADFEILEIVPEKISVTAELIKEEHSALAEDVFETPTLSAEKTDVQEGLKGNTETQEIIKQSVEEMLNSEDNQIIEDEDEE